ncbi:STAS-like domain-containing protein [Methyloversatilis sp.]|uniref:STAS-like domain-containing protein n=1 Tax=Methyloversatilis sp. TaxID=2569862 RepID=UPI003D29A14E
MSQLEISIARDFSETPAGRHTKDSATSGERFREEVLAPALRKAEEVVIDLDGTLGYGSSFLEEAFGGLVRQGFTPEQLHQRMQIKSSTPTYLRRVWQYIEEEGKRSK